jgi:arylsulfatase
LVLGTLPFLAHPWYDPTNDGSIYLAVARSVAAGDGPAYLDVPFVIRPPGFPLLIAPFAGPAEIDFASINRLVAAFGAAAVLLLFVFLRERVGWLPSLAASLAVWLNPGFRRLSNQVMSDVPGLALLLACLLIDRWASRRPAWWREVLLALAIGASAYVRSPLILLVPAIVASRAWSHFVLPRGSRARPAALAARVGTLAAVACLAVLPWSLHARANAPQPPVDQTRNHSLATAMWHTDPGDPGSPRYGPGEILLRAARNAPQISDVLGSRMQIRVPGDPPPSGARRASLAAFALLFTGALAVVAARRREPAEIFALAALGVAALYFVFTDRLVLPVWLLGFAAAVELVRDAARRFAGGRAAAAAAALITVLAAVDFAPRPGWRAVEERHARMVETAAAVEAALAADARLASAQGFHFAAYLGRPVYNLIHASRRAGRVDAAELVIDKYGLNTVVLSPASAQDRPFVEYFERAYGPGQAAGEALVWRVRRRPNIVLITVDTLRADHLSVNGYRRATSPRIDAFAAGAWHFTGAITVLPKTGPALATLFTGRHPEEHGVRSNFDAIPDTLPLLAERLQAMGYRTAAFVGNPVLRQELGFDRGFEHYEVHDGKHGDGVAAVNHGFRAWAEAQWDRAAFVWLHYMDPHGPYTPPAEYEALFLDDDLAQSDLRVPPATGEEANPNKVLGAIPLYQQHEGETRVAAYVARYDAEIRYVDTAVGEILDFLDERGLYEPAAIVFTSDHGESLGEHNFYFEHGWFAYDPTLRVPLMVKEPGQAEGRVVERQVSNLEVLPALLALAGGPREGRALLEPGADGDAPVLVENADRYPEKHFGVRTSAWKFLAPAGGGAEELYDLRADPAELRNLAGERPEEAGRLRAALEAALVDTRSRAVQAAREVADDVETIERLRALGYTE